MLLVVLTHDVVGTQSQYIQQIAKLETICERIKSVKKRSSLDDIDIKWHCTIFLLLTLGLKIILKT
jgi:hypothetical protein